MVDKALFVLVLLVAFFLLLADTQGDKETPASPEPGPKPEPVAMSERCINGVVYYIHTEGYVHGKFGYMAPKFNRASRVVPC